MSSIAQDFKTGYVAIVGRPNVGKSTLVNKLLSFRLSIITPKPQTTRHRILGIKSGENYQIIFWDTPGLIDPVYKLQSVMVKAAQTAIAEADVNLFLIEAAAKLEPAAKDVDILNHLILAAKPIILAINKVDLLEKRLLLPLIDAYQKLHNFADIVPISALQGENLGALEEVIVRLIPTGPAFYPQDSLTEHPERFFVSEIIREKILLSYGDEVPYSTAVVIDEFREQKGRKDLIKARIVVEKSSQKAIIIGKGGSALKKVGQLARQEIEEFLGRPVFLELWVAVREKWRQKDAFLKEFGYE